MRDDRDPVNPPPPAHPARPQLGARPFAGGQSPSPRPASGVPTPSRSPRPFAPRQAGHARTPEPARAEPVVPAPPQEPAATEPPIGRAPSWRRTPRLLAALVQEEQVAVWPVDATLERPAPPAAHNEMAGALTEWESLTPPAPAGSEEDVSGPERSDTSPITDAPETVRRPDDAGDAATSALEISPPHASAASAPPSVDEFLAYPARGSSLVPGTQPTASVPNDETATDTAQVLEAIAQRVRSGEIVVPQSRQGRGGDAAVLAAVLASLLGGHDAS